MKLLAVIRLCLVLSVVAVAGCQSEAPPPPSSVHQDQRAAIEAGAFRVFSNAILLKPRETVPATNLEFTLAPLLVQEIAGSNTNANASPATIYYQAGAIQIGGITRPQMTYAWSCGQRSMRGVRLTLDSRSLPVIWEVLYDQARPRVVFVSRSLEEKAKARFGSPPPGRIFSVEQSINIAPDVFVARLIEDGPTPMGPIVHQTASGQIVAVICRCMPTQAGQLVATKYYELQRLRDDPEDSIQICIPDASLAEMLRLPPVF